MNDQDYTAKLDELDELLNGSDVPMQPDRVWMLLAEVSQHDHVGIYPAVAGGDTHA